MVLVLHPRTGIWTNFGGAPPNLAPVKKYSLAPSESTGPSFDEASFVRRWPFQAWSGGPRHPHHDTRDQSRDHQAPRRTAATVCESRAVEGGIAVAGYTDAASPSTGAMNRYPRRGTVSMNRGLSAESPSAWRILLSRFQAVLEIAEGGTRPNLLLQLLAGDDSARLFEKRQEYPKRLLLKADADSVFAEDARPRVQFEGAKANVPGLCG